MCSVIKYRAIMNRNHLSFHLVRASFLYFGLFSFPSFRFHMLYLFRCCNNKLFIFYQTLYFGNLIIATFSIKKWYVMNTSCFFLNFYGLCTQLAILLTFLICSQISCRLFNIIRSHGRSWVGDRSQGFNSL